MVAATVLRRPEWSTGQVSRQRVRTAQVQRIGRDLHMNAPDGARNGQHRRQGDLRGRVDDEREINKNHSTQVPQSPSCLSLPTFPVVVEERKCFDTVLLEEKIENHCVLQNEKHEDEQEE